MVPSKEVLVALLKRMWSSLIMLWWYWWRCLRATPKRGRVPLRLSQGVFFFLRGRRHRHCGGPRLLIMSHLCRRIGADGQSGLVDDDDGRSRLDEGLRALRL